MRAVWPRRRRYGIGAGDEPPAERDQVDVLDVLTEPSGELGDDVDGVRNMSENVDRASGANEAPDAR